MENRSSKVIAIVGLIAGVVGLSLGFAAFSNTLTIKAAADVTPDRSTFNVDLSWTNTNIESLTAGAHAADVASTTTAENATIANADIATQPGTASITGLKAHFTEPGQTVTYSFYAANTGKFIAYLNSIAFADSTLSATGVYGSGNKKCAPASGSTVTAGLMQTACDHVHISVAVNNDTYTAATTGIDNISGHSLGIGAFEPIVVTITYDPEVLTGDGATGPIRADGAFDVDFGEITLTYNSVD